MEKSNPKKSVLAIFKMSQRVADIYEPVLCTNLLPNIFFWNKHWP